MNIRNYGVVSMPYIGLPPFLHFEKFFENWELKTVSMPYIGRGNMKMSTAGRDVSMPYIGLPPLSTQ